MWRGSSCHAGSQSCRMVCLDEAELDHRKFPGTAFPPGGACWDAAKTKFGLVFFPAYQLIPNLNCCLIIVFAQAWENFVTVEPHGSVLETHGFWWSLA